MKLPIVLLFLCFLGIASLALADDIKIPNDTPMDPDRTVCLTTGYTGYPGVVGQLLVTDTWYTFGPIQTAAGCAIDDVMVDLDVSQTWVGDLVAEVWYDRDCNGSFDVGPVRLLCRPNLAQLACVIPSDECCGCSGDLNGIYTFSDSGTEALGDPTCPSTFPTGNCYLPAPESANPFAVFDGEATGGCFYLLVGDAAAGDDTTLRNWKVWVKCSGPVPNEPNSWGEIKSIYR